MTMQLNHLNLPVPNVQQSTAFFEKHFGFTCVDTKGDHLLAVLKGDDNFTLVLMSETFNRSSSSTYPDAFHLGFLLPEAEAVKEKYKNLLDAGVPLEREPAHMRGVFGFYFKAPGNLLIEISAPAD